MSTSTAPPPPSDPAQPTPAPPDRAQPASASSGGQPASGNGRPLAAPLPTLATLLDQARGYLGEEALATVAEAYHFAAEAHEGARRKSGEPYITHPLTTAILLASMHMDPTTIVAGLLHDVVEDTAATLDDVRERFGPAVAHLVDGVTKVGNFGTERIEKRIELGEGRQGEGERDKDKDRGRKGDAQQQRRQAENVKKMVLAMAEDPRVVIVKLADRLHNMRTLDALPPQKQQRKALETREIYAPLAGRLGMAQIKWELEDLAFKYLEPDAYDWLVDQIAEQRAARESYVRGVGDALRAELAAHGVQAEVKGRAKHLYSIYRKLQRPEIDMDLGRVYDLFALRVLVDTLQACYQALGQVHALWTPVNGRFKDYIASPKPNGYQSLHTTVIGPDGRQLEVQIRTHEMHRLAEYGVAAHLHYKEAGSARSAPASMTKWIESLMSWQDDLGDSTDFMDSLKIDVFQDQVFVFSPRGDIIDLPARSTPVDFAYRIHTELGHRTIGAKVDGKMVPLDTPLHNGQVVEILTTRTPHGPSRDWADFVASAGAKSKIRAWFKRQNREKNIADGRELFERELQRLAQRTLGSLSAEQLQDLATALEFKTPDDLFAAIGYGTVGPQQAVGRLKLRDESPAEFELPIVAPPPAPASGGGISVMGVGDLLTRLAPCCHPAPGDDIVGYITRNRGITVHRASCPRIQSEQETERLVQVEWGPSVAQAAAYTVSIVVNAWDREGLIRDISTAIAEERVSITALTTVTSASERSATIRVGLRVSSVEQLSRVFSRIERVRSVLDVSRENPRKANTA